MMELEEPECSPPNLVELGMMFLLPGSGLTGGTGGTGVLAPRIRIKSWNWERLGVLTSRIRIDWWNWLTYFQDPD
jgi:hypothetical protein